MESRSPGVNVIENNLITQYNSIESAVPLFIGFTEKVTSESLPIIKTLAEYEHYYGGNNLGNGVLYHTIKHFFDNGGLHCFIFSLGSYVELTSFNVDDISEAIKSQQLKSVIGAEQSITLLAFPDCVLIPDSNVEQWHKVWSGMLSLSQLRSGIFAVLETPRVPRDAVTCLNSYHSPYLEHAGMWWPHLITSYSVKGSQVIIPPSGAVMAAIQKNDHERGVWSAPANIKLSKVIKPEYSWLDAHRLYNENGVALNLIRSFPGKGTRLWGSRTLVNDIDSQFRYIQTRRFISWVEQNIIKCCRVFLFEPNNEITWFKLKGTITNWLRKVWYLGGLYGQQEDTAFNVLIGINESMSETDVCEGKLIVKVKLSVMYPAEFIDLTVSLNMNQT